MFSLRDAEGKNVVANPDSTPDLKSVEKMSVTFQNQAVKDILKLELAEELSLNDQDTYQRKYMKRFLPTDDFDDTEQIQAQASDYKTIIEVLTQNYTNANTLNLLMKNEGSAGTQFLELRLSTITFNKEEQRVATFHDVTESKRLARSEANTRMVSLLSSSVTHEMVTPLRCIISFANSLQKEL